MSFKDRFLNTSVQFLNDQRSKLKQTDVWQTFMGAGAVSGHVPNTSQGTLPPQGSRSPRTADRSTILSCESCNANFTIFKRKKVCMDCNRLLCSTCLPKEANKPSSQRRCDQCQVLWTGNFTRQNLEKFKVKYMKSYLARYNIPTQDCKEKNDLIELLMHFSRHSQHFRDLEEHQRHFQTLQERMRENSTLGSASTELQRRETSNNRDSSSSGASSEQTTPSLPRSTLGGSSNAPGGSSETEEERQQRQERRRQQEMRETEQRLHHELHDDEMPDPRPRRQKMSIEQVAEEENIENLSIRQLKEILATNFVDYKGCVEKPELIERVKRLWRQNKQHKDEGIKENESDECKICMDAAIDCVLLECGHMVTCTSCGRRLAECPVCRQYVSRVVHTFKA